MVNTEYGLIDGKFARNSSGVFLIEYWIHRSGLSGMEYWTLDSGHRTMDTGQ